MFGAYRGQPLGTFGALATLSFHDTKNLSCGEGGALMINDPGYVERAEIIREKGTNRTRFFRGQVDKLLVRRRLELPAVRHPRRLPAGAARVHDRIQRRRHAIWARFAAELADWAAAHGARLPVVPPHCEHPAHIFHLLLPSLDARTRLLAHLREALILAVFHYQPLHLRHGPPLRRAGGQCPVTEDVSDRLVRLPLFFQLTDDDQSRVIDAVRAFRP